MKYMQNSIHIINNFGFIHFCYRLWFAIKARCNDISQNRKHASITRHMQGESIVIECLGKLYKIDIRDRGLHRDLLCDRIREPVATSHLLHIIKKEDIFLDIGANIGYYSILLSDRCKHVFALEPEEKNFNSLIKNIEINNINNITAKNIALSDTNEDLSIVLSDKSNWHTVSKKCENKERKTIAATTVDKFCIENCIIPTIAKMDVEGFEKYIVNGMEEVLNKINVLFIELHTTHLTISETQQIVIKINNSGLSVTRIIKYDRPGLWYELDASYLNDILKGDFGIYEIFFERFDVSVP